MIRRNRIALLISLLGIALGASGGTCVVIEEGPPGDNMEEMEEQQEEAGY
jgi:hypothetical protein